MAVFFVLGPSEWRDSNKTVHLGFTPLDKRRELTAILRSCGHDAFILRDIATKRSEGLAEKFLRVLKERKPSHCLLYWPAHATIDTAQDELVIVRTLVAQGQEVPELWIMAQDFTVQEIRGEFHVHDPSGRSSYVRDLLKRLPCLLSNWCNHEDLEEQIRENAESLHDN